MLHQEKDLSFFTKRRYAQMRNNQARVDENELQIEVLEKRVATYQNMVP